MFARAKALLVAALAAALLATAASARAGDVEDPEEVEVRGSEAGGFVSRASVDGAPRAVTDAASLVESMPGVHVRRLGADDSFATLSVRGTSSTQVAVLLAGVPLTGGADPTLDLATLPLWPGAQARVFRSFAPAAIGRGSLGGTLVLDPPSPRAPARTDAWAAIGSFGSRRLRVGDVRGDPEGVRVATGLSASRSDDDFSYLDPLATLGSGSNVFTTRANAGHAQASGLASVAIPAGRGALTVTGLAQGRRQELPGTVHNPTPLQRLDSSRLLAALELTEPAGSGAFGVRGWGRREGLAIRDARSSAQLAGAPTETSDAIVAAGASVGWRGRPSEATRIEARADGSAERFAPGTWVAAMAPPGARRTSGGAALDAAWCASERLDISTSARGDAWFDASDDGGSSAEARPTGHVGLEWSPEPFVLASHAGVLARPPSFVERFGNRGAFLGEPGLRPESAATVDAGARFDRRLGHATLHAELALFATWAEDLIVFVGQGIYGRAKATNIGRARLFGAEAEAHVSAWRADLRASYTGLSTANEAACAVAGAGGASTCERPPLPGRPEHDLVIDAAYGFGPLRVRYGIDVVTGMRADLTGTVIVPARAIHGVGARLEVPGVRGLVLGIDVRNLFDLRVAQYAGATGPVRAPIGDLYDYPLPGRSLLATAELTSPAR